MKIRKFLLIAFFGVLLCFGSFSASAQGKLSVVPYLKTDYVLVSALNEESIDFRLKIRDNSGNVLYSSKWFSGNSPYHKVFDFSDLPDGKYVTRMIRSDKTVLEDAFTIVDGKPNLKTKYPRPGKMTAKVWNSGDFLFVAYADNDFDVYKMKIQDEKGDVLFESALPESATYTGKFDVSSLPPGNYSVSLMSDQKASRYGFTK